MKLIVQAFLNIYSIVLKSEDVICRSTSAHIRGGFMIELTGETPEMCTMMSALKRRKSTKLTAAFDEKEQNYLEETCQYKSDKIEKKIIIICPQLLTQIHKLNVSKIRK